MKNINLKVNAVTTAFVTSCRFFSKSENKDKSETKKRRQKYYYLIVIKCLKCLKYFRCMKSVTRCLQVEKKLTVLLYR